MLAVGITGIITGILSGVITSLLLIPYIMKILGISLGNVGIHFYPIIPILSILTTGFAFFCGIQTPIRLATGITPVQAIKYRVNNEASHGYKKKRTSQVSIDLYWRMAKDQFKKDKKKTIVVILSLATSFIVFYCLTTLIDSQGTRTVYPNYLDADFIIQNNTQTTEDMASLQPAINEKFMSDFENTEGIAEVHTVSGIPVVFPYSVNGFADLWIKGYSKIKPYLSYSETVLDYRMNPEKYYGMVKGIDEVEFDYLNEALGNTVNKQDFLNGNTAILQYAGFEIPKIWLGRTVSFTAENRPLEITISAVSYESYYGASTNFGANLIVSEDYVKTLTEEPYILSLTVKYDQSYNENTENAMKNLLKKSSYSNDLLYISKYDEMKTIQDSQGGMFEIGTVIALLLLLVGMLNYINTMSSSMQNRKLTFSIMESVGMSRKQQIKLLIREGILYAAGSILITFTIMAEQES